MKGRGFVGSVGVLLACCGSACGAAAEPPWTGPAYGPALDPAGAEGRGTTFGVEIQPGSALSSDEVRRVVGARATGFHQCADALGAAMPPGNEGSLPLRYTVGLAGNIVSVDVLGDMPPDLSGLQCVLDQTEALAFPAASGATVLVLTLRYGAAR